MDQATAMAILVPALVAFLGAVGTAAGFLARKVWTGSTYYADKLWNLLERGAHKHFEFMDDLSSSLNAQTELLQEIKQGTDKTAKVLDAMGSDPTGSGEIKTLVERLKDSPILCKYSKDEIEKYLKVILKHKQKQQVEKSE